MGLIKLRTALLRYSPTYLQKAVNGFSCITPANICTLEDKFTLRIPYLHFFVASESQDRKDDILYKFNMFTVFCSDTGL